MHNTRLGKATGTRAEKPQVTVKLKPAPHNFELREIVRYKIAVVRAWHLVVSNVIIERKPGVALVIRVLHPPE